ncbi:D-aminopeptidase [Xinfangfangia sp. CPCC 101601]|uniref:D-aminopeptidase n=1 Tax=Pseudogemmobacter lacusdianii TaxID=3069608 RepID=A0ABU0VXV1_9RHOB|nr:D-aminopeptidase [Xinfangfangia sp. CPCC 101601]MDQ2066571.1 D-aminopeptidase [Xinfangfangia sp. CPCC 101601]
MDLNLAALTAALDALPKLYAGPGGVAGVVKDGKVIASRAWGYASLEDGQAMTPQTRLPICSISKQFTCQVLLASVGDPAQLDGKVAAFLPQFTGPLPSTRQLCDNQSGVRDYWALTVLQGGLAEQEFRRDDALPLIARMKTGHFPPGTSYSYCNCNYRIVSEMIEAATGETLEHLYAKHIWGPAGMKSAVLTSDTRYPEDGVVGYEGNDAAGYFPAENAIYWVGDAGISASVEDMLAYEAWIDAGRDDASHLYRQISEPPHFADGKPAAYGYGLAHHLMGGMAVTGHGGALRGFRAHRLYAADARLSVVVMFNHEADAFGAAKGLLEAALGVTPVKPAPVAESWEGQWLADNGLLVRLEPARTSVTMRYATGPETLTLNAEGKLAAAGLTLERQGADLAMVREKENVAPKLTPLPVLNAANGAEIAGRYASDELEAEMVIEARDGGVYARFEGMLGRGRMERMAPAGKDVWILATRRSMDAPPPGDWTFVVQRDAAGQITGAQLGCWLARGVPYRKV